MSAEPTVEAYPLAWPVNVPRAKRREPARFKNGNSGTDYTGNWKSAGPLDMGTALTRLRDELRKINARNVVVSTNVPTRSDGMPYAKSRQPEDPGVAVYFVRGRLETPQRVCLPCDKYTRIADNINAVALHLDAMRGMERWGVGTSDQLFSGFKALPPAQIKREWWQVLDVSPEATLEEINETRRRLANVFHPDKPTGNAAKMTEINAAHAEAMRIRMHA
jgi:hypothetical protein